MEGITDRTGTEVVPSLVKPERERLGNRLLCVTVSLPRPFQFLPLDSRLNTRFDPHFVPNIIEVRKRRGGERRIEKIIPLPFLLSTSPPIILTVLNVRLIDTIVTKLIVE